MPEFILKLSRFIWCHRFVGAIGTNGLNADNSALKFLSSRSLALYKQASFMYSSEQQLRTRRGGLSLTRGAELYAGWWWDCTSRRSSLEGAEMRHSPREAVRDR